MSNPASLKILLIDDDARAREVLADMLTSLGHSVVQAAGGREGLARLEAGEAVDLILTDLAMPEMSGGRTRAEQLWSIDGSKGTPMKLPGELSRRADGSQQSSPLRPSGGSPSRSHACRAECESFSRRAPPSPHGSSVEPRGASHPE